MCGVGLFGRFWSSNPPPLIPGNFIALECVNCYHAWEGLLVGGFGKGGGVNR